MRKLMGLLALGGFATALSGLIVEQANAADSVEDRRVGLGPSGTVLSGTGNTANGTDSTVASGAGNITYDNYNFVGGRSSRC